MQDFHGRYYHPSNARFWFYGDDPAEERLQLLSKYLDEFEPRPVDSTVHAQPLRQVRNLTSSLDRLTPRTASAAVLDSCIAA